MKSVDKAKVALGKAIDALNEARSEDRVAYSEYVEIFDLINDAITQLDGFPEELRADRKTVWEDGVEIGWKEGAESRTGSSVKYTPNPYEEPVAVEPSE